MNSSLKASLVLVSIFLIAVGAWFVFQKSAPAQTPTPENISGEEVHFHAGFQVYLSNQRQDFSDFKYMQVSPCGSDVAPQDEQIEKAHLHDGVGDIVHAHVNGGTWGDLFQNIKYTFPENMQVQGYVNGQRVPEILSMPIIPNSSVVIFIGENKNIDAKLASRVTQEHIQEVEKKSENCAKP